MQANEQNRVGKMVNAFDPTRLDHLNERTRQDVLRRIQLLGPAYRLFYQEPVQVSRAEGVILYDRDGNDYLDAYNNVVSVGHSHPRVVEAVTKQLGTLCTHTRYIQDGILDFAEDILPTFGGDIGHIMFTCTGSEANDLAMRIAMHKTGRKGIVITSEAYHGNSHLTSSFSPSLGDGSPLGTHVRCVSAPDSYRVRVNDIGQWMARQVEAQIADLERHGEGLAAFIADSLFSSDGIYADPAGVLAPVAEVVRKAGGLFIADEVQSGFGRSGDRLWGFQRHGIAPDIVTMGKPMGNGYPVAAVALRPEVVEAFGRNTRYFNTFGGNSVAIAAAQATFDVIRDENLQANAANVGRQIQAGIKELATRHDIIGDVRGVGLYIGIEIIAGDGDDTPNGVDAARIVNGLRERRILISATGYYSNVLKIRPPLVFNGENVARLVQGVEDVLTALRS